MWKKRVILSILITTGWSAAWADVFPYVGLSAGYDKGSIKFTDVNNIRTNFGQDGALGGIFAGLGGKVSNSHFYLAVEGFGNGSTVQTNNKVITTATGTAVANLKMEYNYGASLLPGILFNDCSMVYLRVGVTRAHYRLYQTAPPSGANSYYDTENPVGGEAGVGFQFFLNNALAVRAEYDYSGYRSFRVFGNKVVPHDNQINGGLMYEFN